ncbi:MAG TPA: type II toxin-antitoxin system mRNA interferase toxin, RelE/StbE family [Verrucomicrobiales bacterium]|nr:type II toxin-antitoxin system mRNA interferase toxin, RelE/StbE family [Verrucomicrobiales bacterium]
MAAALQVWSATYSRAFDDLPAPAQQAVQRAVDNMGSRLTDFPHQRLKGRSESRLRVGNYRVIYEYDVQAGRIYLHYVGHRRDIYRR